MIGQWLNYPVHPKYKWSLFPTCDPSNDPCSLPVIPQMILVPYLWSLRWSLFPTCDSSDDPYSLPVIAQMILVPYLWSLRWSLFPTCDTSDDFCSLPVIPQMILVPYLWSLKWSLRRKALPQTEHENGRSSVWVRTWILRLYDLVKWRWQNSQMYCFTSRFAPSLKWELSIIIIIIILLLFFF